MLKLFSHLHSRKKESEEWGFTSKDDASKSRLIQLVLTLSFIYLMVIILFSVSGIQLTKAASATCLDIAGQGTQVLVGGVANSGVIDFDDPGIPYAQEACVEDPDGNGLAPFLVKGWAWDTNLGWVSLYCSGGFNLGIPCGPNPYGVTINDSGELSGYAWGDGSGWISFDNGASSQVRVEVDDPDCQGYIYGFTPPKVGCPAHGGSVNQGYQYTFAWSDNVKWIDLNGVIIPWFSLVQEVNDTTVTVELLPDPTGITKLAGTVPKSGAIGPGKKYDLRVDIEDQLGNDMWMEPRYTITVDPVWIKDTVKKDQTETGIGNELALVPVHNDPYGNRAVTKPAGMGDFMNTIFACPPSCPSEVVLQASIGSLAPTSNMNGVLDVSDVMLFPYETFVSPTDKVGLPLEENDLILGTVDIMVYDDDTMSCVYGADAACNPEPVPPNGALTTVLKFAPETEITLLEQFGADPGKEDVIEMSVGIEEDYNMSTIGSATIEFVGDIDNLAVNGILKLVNSGVDFDGGVWDDTVSSDFVAAIYQAAETQAPTNFGGIYMYSIVHAPNGVEYYSNKLPREVGSSGIEPVAVLKGNVYTTGSSGITTAAEAIRSLGDVSTNILRDTIYKNVSSIVAGATEPTGIDATLVMDFMTPGILRETLDSDNVIELMPDLVGPRVYYAKGSDVYIGQVGTTVPWTGNRTVIVIGGNVYIDANLYNGTNSNAKLGIIALKDLSSATPEVEGHVYIHKDVSNIQANIFADGSVFSYDPVNGVPGGVLGEPLWGSLTEAEQNLKYQQLLIEGSVASQNTVGGSGLIQAIKGDGTVATDVEQARLYDLNFLRYYTGLIQRDMADLDTDGIFEVLCSGGIEYEDESYKDRLVTGDGDPWSALDPMNPGGCLWPPSYVDGNYHYAPGLDEDTQLAATYINFDPPSADLPGFTVGAGVDVTVRPR